MLLQYDREELFRKVWEQPMLKVAEEYGVSSVALGKTCKKLSVPVPGRGHWAKLAHGHPGTEKPTLPKLEKVPVIYRCPPAQKPHRNGNRSDHEFVAIARLLDSGELKPPSIDPTYSFHPLVSTTASRLRSSSRKSESGILEPREFGGLDVKVSESMLDRALQVMEKVISVLERLGHTVTVSGENHTLASIEGEHVRFSIEEPVQRIVTSKARVPNPTDRWDYDETVTHELGGKLVLLILTHTWGQFEQRKRWSDGKIQRVESLVEDFVAGLLRTAVSLRRQKEQRDREETARKRQEEERARLRDLIQVEEKKLEELNNWMDNWERAGRMRRFIEAYAEQSRSWPSEEQVKCRAWIEWASQQADRIDPLITKKPTSVLDRKDEFRWW